MATSVKLAVHQDTTASASGIEGLTVDGRPVTPKPASRVAIGNWAYLVVLPRPSSAPTLPGIRRLGAREILGSALAVHLLRAHSGLPAGVVLLFSFARIPPTAVHGRTVTRAQRRHSLGLPLTVTPPLGLRHYVFPVAGAAEYIDTYGAFRSDVAGNWHH